MRVRITPATAYSHGHIEKTLVQCGITPPPSRADGVVELELSEYQLSQFQLRGGAHHVERLPDVVAPAEVAPAFRVPSVEEVMDLLACPQGIAEDVVERKRLIISGLTPEEAEQTLREARYGKGAESQPEQNPATPADDKKDAKKEGKK